MELASSIVYRKWAILPFAKSLPNGKWAVNYEIETIDGDGRASFQGALPAFEADTKNDALIAACADARRQIDGIIADPRGDSSFV